MKQQDELEDWIRDNKEKALKILDKVGGAGYSNFWHPRVLDDMPDRLQEELVQTYRTEDDSSRTLYDEEGNETDEVDAVLGRHLISKFLHALDLGSEADNYMGRGFQATENEKVIRQELEG